LPNVDQIPTESIQAEDKTIPWSRWWWNADRAGGRHTV